MEDLDAASVEDVSEFFRTYYAPNNAVLTVVGDVDPADGPAPGPSATSAASRPTRRSRRSATCRCRRSSARSAARPSTTRSRCRASTSAFRAPVFGDHAARRARHRRPGPRRRQGQSRLHRRLVREERIAQDVALFTLGFVGGASIAAGWATVRPGVDGRRVSRPRSTRSSSGSPASPSRDDELERAKALIETDELGALAAGRGAGRPALDVRDAVRRPGPRSTACCRATWR